MLNINFLKKQLDFSPHKLLTVTIDKYIFAMPYLDIIWDFRNFIILNSIVDTSS